MRCRLIFCSLAAVYVAGAVAGCGKRTLPDWMTTEEVKPVIQPQESAPLSEPEQSPPAAKAETAREEGVEPLTLEDLAKRSAEGRAEKESPEKTELAMAELPDDEWNGNVRLKPLPMPAGVKPDEPVDKETPRDDSGNGKGAGTEEPEGAKEVKVEEMPRAETREQKLSRLIAEMSGEDGAVPYKLIQDQLLFPGAGELKPGPATRPVEGKIVREEMTPVPVEGAGDKKDEGTDAGEGAMPMPIPARSTTPELAMNTEVVISGGAVQVNERYITADEILDGLHYQFSELPPDITEEGFRRKAVQIIGQGVHTEIQRELVYVEAEDKMVEQLLEKLEEDVDKEMRRLIAEGGGSREALKSKFRREGTSLESVERLLRRSIMIRTYLQQKFYPRIVVNRSTLWNYYRKHKKEFSSEKKVRMQIIAAPFSEFPPLKDFFSDPNNAGRRPSTVERTAAKNAAHAHILNAVNALERGEDFTKAATTYSRGPMRHEGGKWGLMGMGNKREKKVEKAAFSQAQGARSGVIEEEDGYYIVKTLEVKEGKVADFVEAQEEIEAKLRREQYSKLQEDYFQKVYDNATINVSGDFLRVVVDHAVERYWYLRE
jgi:parvulin-like peptidyl-prolyl isomerase